MKTRAVLAIALACAGACRVGPEYERHDPATSNTWTEAAQLAGASANEPETRWWKSFGDPVLDGLIERALQQNLDLAIARSRVREARALRDFAAGGKQPTLDANASYARVSPSENTPAGAVARGDYDLYDVGFDARWEVDLFGRLDRAVEAAQAGLEAAEEGRRDAVVSLLGEVARNYVELRGLQQQIAITRSNLAAQEDTSRLTATREKAGFATGLDSARARAQVASTRSEIPAFESDVRATIHRLGVLLGSQPDALSAELNEAAPVPTAPDRVALGVPSDLLRRRPDVRRAERELARATALTAEATADLFPRLTLGASFGQQSIQGSDVFDAASRAWSIGGNLTAPIFNGGTLHAIVHARDAQQEQALLTYEQSVLRALAEVEDELAAVARERERHASLAEALVANQRAVTLANDLNARGLVDFFDVLAAQGAVFHSESELARSSTALAARTVALYKALGGGAELGEP